MIIKKAHIYLLSILFLIISKPYFYHYYIEYLKHYGFFDLGMLGWICYLFIVRCLYISAFCFITIKSLQGMRNSNQMQKYLFSASFSIGAFYTLAHIFGIVAFVISIGV